MPQQVNLPAQDYTPGSYSAEIDVPNRRDGELITMTREAPGWPAGHLFQLRIYERERNGALTLLYSAMIDGGPAPFPITGLPNSPMQIGLQWPADKDKDVIRFEVDVLQTFRTAIRLEFV